VAIVFYSFIGCGKLFVVFVPFEFDTIPSYWRELVLSLSSFFCSPALLFGGAKRF